MGMLGEAADPQVLLTTALHEPRADAGHELIAGATSHAAVSCQQGTQRPGRETLSPALSPEKFNVPTDKETYWKGPKVSSRTNKR